MQSCGAGMTLLSKSEVTMGGKERACGHYPGGKKKCCPQSEDTSKSHGEQSVDLGKSEEGCH